jgi:3-vinyl bacteriochlorophyllide hydratase
MTDGGSPALRGTGPTLVHRQSARKPARTICPLYTPEEQRRRDETLWTLVQGLLAPFQFVVFLVSITLVLRCLYTGDGTFAADASVIAKTFTLYTIMVTGSIWEKVVFGKWLFAPAFFWEDVVSMFVIALHTAYVVMLLGKIGTVEARLLVALAGYVAYVVNAAQFLLKLRAARLQAKDDAERAKSLIGAGA